MKELILKLLGFDKTSIQTLRKEIVDLEITISTLSKDLSEIYTKVEKAFIIINQLGIDIDNELWWEKDRCEHFDNPDTAIIASRIRHDAIINWVKKYPTLKERKTFHGGCIGCVTPIEYGIGKCLGCQFLSGWNKPSLFKDKNKN